MDLSGEQTPTLVLADEGGTYRKMHQFLLDISRLLTNNDFDASRGGKIIQKEQHVSHGLVLLLINIKILTLVLLEEGGSCRKIKQVSRGHI